MARQYSHRRATQNLHDCQIVTQLSASHGSRFPLAFVVRTGNQGLAQRLGASPNRPVWSGAAVQAPKEGRSRETTTRCIKGLKNVNRPIYGSSQPRHTLVLERIPATSAPTVQTAKRCHVWLFGRLEPLVETLYQSWPTRLSQDYYTDRAGAQQPSPNSQEDWRGNPTSSSQQEETATRGKYINMSKTPKIKLRSVWGI